MKKTTILLFALLTLVLVSCKDDGKGGEGAEIQSLPAIDFSKKIETDKGIILDVRTPKEYEAGHLPSAQHNNIMDGDFDQKLEKMDKDKIYYVYCKAGGRSMKACRKMQTMGFKHIYNMDGGFTSWKAEGLPFE